MRNQKVDDALSLYRKARLRALLGKATAFLTGRQHILPNLKDFIGQEKVQGWQYVGIREIPIQKIVGSEDPSPEFDCEFFPLNSYSRERWLDIAFGMLSGIDIPPIELIRLPSGYYAQSGLYRISVYRMMGHKAISAYVTSWDLLEKRFVHTE